jgi:hypothetical protein
MHRFLLTSIALAGALTVATAAHAAPARQAQNPPAAAVAPAGCPGNLLVNPNFDGPSRKTETEGTSLSSAVSTGWNPWLIRGDARNNREPEYKVEQVAIGGDAMRTRSGGQSMKWFTTWGTHTAGIYQRVPVRPGSTVDFSIYGLSYSGEADGWSDEKKTFLSDKVQPGNYRMWVGIDPTGAVPGEVGAPPPATVIWSEPTLQADEWVRMNVQAQAQAPFVTVYTKGQPEWAVKHNDSWWEDACLRVVGAAKAIKPAIGAKSAAKPTVKAATGAKSATGAKPAVGAKPAAKPTVKAATGAKPAPTKKP